MEIDLYEFICLQAINTHKNIITETETYNIWREIYAIYIHYSNSLYGKIADNNYK